MRWIDRYNKEKERKYKEEHSSITINKLCSLFVQFLRSKNLLHFYEKTLFSVFGFNMYHDWWLSTYASCGYAPPYLNDEALFIFDTKYNLTRYLNVGDTPYDKGVFNLIHIHKHISPTSLKQEFIKFLREHGYYRYIKIIYKDEKQVTSYIRHTF